MPVAKPGEIWRVDLGMVAKVRPCLILTHLPQPDELDVFTVVAHTTSLRGNRWEIPFEKSFLDDDGAFDVQRIATVATVKLERKLGELTSEEFDTVLDRLAERLGF
jgi:mRNA interferase MazF